MIEPVHESLTRSASQCFGPDPDSEAVAKGRAAEQGGCFSAPLAADLGSDSSVALRLGRDRDLDRHGLAARARRGWTGIELLLCANFYRLRAKGTEDSELAKGLARRR